MVIPFSASWLRAIVANRQWAALPTMKMKPICPVSVQRQQSNSSAIGQQARTGLPKCRHSEEMPKRTFSFRDLADDAPETQVDGQETIVNWRGVWDDFRNYLLEIAV
jgi:hypothetical protein